MLKKTVIYNLSLIFSTLWFFAASADAAKNQSCKNPSDIAKKIECAQAELTKNKKTLEVILSEQINIFLTRQTAEADKEKFLEITTFLKALIDLKQNVEVFANAHCEYAATPTRKAQTVLLFVTECKAEFYRIQIESVNDSI